MRSFDPYGHRGSGFVGTVVGWLFSLVAVAALLQVFIALVTPLLPWIGAAILLTIAVRRWMTRTYY